MSQVNLRLPLIGEISKANDSSVEGELPVENLCERIRSVTDRQLRLLCRQIEKTTANYFCQTNNLDGFGVEVVEDIVKSCFSHPESFRDQGAVITLVGEEDVDLGVVSLTLNEEMSMSQSSLAFTLSVIRENREVYTDIFGLNTLEWLEVAEQGQGEAQDVDRSTS